MGDDKSYNFTMRIIQWILILFINDSIVRSLINVRDLKIFNKHAVPLGTVVVVRTKQHNDQDNDSSSVSRYPVLIKNDAIKSLRHASKLLVNALLPLSLYSNPQSSNAQVKGAFEMDLEFYLRNILKGKPSDDAQTFKNRPIYKSPRTMNRVFAERLLDVVVQQIVATVGNNEANNKGLAYDKQIAISNLTNIVDSKVPYMLNYFRTFAPITTQDLSDQYYFDMVMYLYYLEAASRIPSSEERVGLRSRVGQEILKLLVDEYGLYNSSGDITLPVYDSSSRKQDSISVAAKSLSKLSTVITAVLDRFKTNGIILDYEFQADDLDDVPYAISSFQDVSSNYEHILIRMTEYTITMTIPSIEPSHQLHHHGQGACYHHWIPARSICQHLLPSRSYRNHYRCCSFVVWVSNQVLYRSHIYSSDAPLPPSLCSS